MPDNLKKLKPKKVRSSESVARNKKLLTAGVIASATLFVVVMLLLLLSSGGGPPGEGIVAQDQESAPTEGADEATIEQMKVPPISIYRLKNPFQPLKDEKVTIDCGELVCPVVPAGGGMVVMPPELTGEAGSVAPQVVSTVVTLEEIFEEDGRLFARITVGDQLFEKVACGDVFANHYKLLTLSKRTGATILYGDERYSFCIGQSIYW